MACVYSIVENQTYTLFLFLTSLRRKAAILHEPLSKTLTIFSGKSIDSTKYTNPDNDPRGAWASIDLSGLATKVQRPNLHFDIIDPETKISYPPNPDRGWSKSPDRVQQMIKEKRVLFPKSPSGRPREKKFLSDLISSVTGFSTVLNNQIVGYTTNGTRELDQIFGERIFPFPKSCILLKELFKQVLFNNDIVLDFFAGSATTAQAVLELNAEGSGNRRFILVQMPEPLEENSEAWKSGYRSIADIGRARIRKVIERMQAGAAEKAKTPGLFEASENTTNGQTLGFQSYRLQYSNFKVWRNDLEGKDAILSQLQMFQEPLAEYRGKHSTLLTELVLKAGFPLTVDVTEKEVDGCLVFEVDGGRMWVVLDKVTTAVFQAAAEARPTAFVTLSGLFEGINADETMANANLQLKEAGVDFKVI